MLEVLTGNDGVRIAEHLRAAEVGETRDAAETLPQELFQQSLFPVAKHLVNYPAWTTAQRKALLKLVDDSAHVIVSAPRLGAKDPLRAATVHDYRLPSDRSGWNSWLKERATKHGVSLNRENIDVLLRTIGEDAWALETELHRWAVAGTALTPLPLAETAVWTWVDAVIKGERQAAEELSKLHVQPVMMLIGSIGQRLYLQTVRFNGGTMEAAGAPAYPWRLSGDAGRYGWNGANSAYWLGRLIETETKCKGQGSLLDPWPLLVSWQSQLLSQHPSISRPR